MIGSAVSHVAGQLNQYLKRTFDLTEDIVVVANLLEQDGTVTPHTDNKLVVFLVNVEKDTAPHPRRNGNEVGADRQVVTFPPIYLNLHVMVAAHFAGGNYAEALKFLSNTVAFFQGRPVLDHANSPELDPRIERLVLDIENLTIQDLSALWTILSGRYLPSILYKVRMVAVDSEGVRARTPALREPSSAVEQ